MIVYLSSFTNTNGAAFPGTLGINATGAGTGDGTEFVKLFVDDLWGARQALLDAAGLTPDGVTETIDTSQLLDAIRKISGSPGEGVIWWKSVDPATSGDRVLLLTGQVILIANYTELVDATYVGDGDNPTASAFYKTSDAGGTTRSTSGTYFVLPDLRGYILRGLDTAASVDPDGASRDMGSIQLDAFQGWQVGGIFSAITYYGHTTSPGTTVSAISVANHILNVFITTAQGSTSRMKAVDDGTNGTPRDSTETRMINIACSYGIRY